MKKKIYNYNFLFQGLIVLLTIIIIPSQKMVSKELLLIVAISMITFIFINNIFDTNIWFERSLEILE